MKKMKDTFYVMIAAGMGASGVCMFLLKLLGMRIEETDGALLTTLFLLMTALIFVLLKMEKLQAYKGERLEH